MPLFDENGTMLFTNEKLSTVLHQSEMISAFLKGNLPPNYSGSPENIKESLSWYWQNTHWSVPIFFVLVLLGAIISGAIISETTLYKNTIKPFVIEYLDAKSPTKSKITPNTQ